MRRAERKYAAAILEIAALALVISTLVAVWRFQVGTEHLVATLGERVDPRVLMLRLARPLLVNRVATRANALKASSIMHWKNLVVTAFMAHRSLDRLERLLHGRGELGRAASAVAVCKLEEVLIAVLAGLGIEARTDEINRGVWVGTDKVAALGIRVTRHITMHGFALNVCADLSHYVGMVPCGIEGRGVTSIDRLRAPVSMVDVRQRVTREFAERLGYNNVVAVPPPEDQ